MYKESLLDRCARLEEQNAKLVAYQESYRRHTAEGLTLLDEHYAKLVAAHSECDAIIHSAEAEIEWLRKALVKHRLEIVEMVTEAFFANRPADATHEQVIGGRE